MRQILLLLLLAASVVSADSDNSLWEPSDGLPPFEVYGSCTLASVRHAMTMFVRHRIVCGRNPEDARSQVGQTLTLQVSLLPNRCVLGTTLAVLNPFSTHYTPERVGYGGIFWRIDARDRRYSVSDESEIGLNFLKVSVGDHDPSRMLRELRDGSRLILSSAPTGHWGARVPLDSINGRAAAIDDLIRRLGSLERNDSGDYCPAD